MNADLDRWQQRFEKEPSLAVGDLLGGRVYLGALNRAQPAEALLHAMAGLDQSRLDAALLNWLKEAIAAENVAGLGYDNPKAFARMLVQSFHAAAAMNLGQTLKWMGGDRVQGEIRLCLNEYFFGQSCDPLGAYYAALGHGQEDRGLLRLWLEVVNLSGYGFVHYGPLGLNGLLQMPDEGQQGPAGRVSDSLLVGVFHFANGLSRANRDKSQLDRYVEFLKAAYPMSTSSWTRKLTEARQRVGLNPVAQQWMASHFPQIFAKDVEIGASQQLPTQREREAMFQRLKREPLAKLRADLGPFLDRYRKYTKETGDSYFLVRTFNSFGSNILHDDPVFVAELAQEATTWEPYNAHSWSLLGRALDESGDWQRAEAVFWQARRRFPHNATSHNQLGDALARRGETAAALAVLEEAKGFFPGDIVIRTSKAYALLWAGKTEEALTEGKEMVRLFPNSTKGYLVVANVLMRQGRSEDASAALAQARAIDSTDANLLKKEKLLWKFQQGNGDVLHLNPPPTGRDSSPDTLAEITGRDFSHAPNLGRATAFRRAGDRGAAREYLAHVGQPVEKRSEMGLIIWMEKGPAKAADYFNDQLKEHPGDAALQLHHGRACQRGNRSPVDWDRLKIRFPAMEAVILTEKNNGRAPHYPIPENLEDPTVTHEERKRAWFVTTLDRDSHLLDVAEEEMVSSHGA